jgi:hypothetical protein
MQYVFSELAFFSVFSSKTTLCFHKNSHALLTKKNYPKHHPYQTYGEVLNSFFRVLTTENPIETTGHFTTFNMTDK